MRVCLDSAPIIYLVENVSPYVDYLTGRLGAEDIVQVCSELSRLECRVKPLRDEEPVLLAAFDTYFASIISETIPLSRSVIDLATDLRARYNFRTPDAIHLASAIHGQCDLFLTNDRQLEKCQEISIELVPS